MKLNLSLPIVGSDIPSMLAAVYAFEPNYQFSYNSTTSALETVIDASVELSQVQVKILSSAKYSVSFVLPVAASMSTTVPPVTTPLG